MKRRTFLAAVAATPAAAIAASKAEGDTSAKPTLTEGMWPVLVTTDAVDSLQGAHTEDSVKDIIKAIRNVGRGAITSCVTKLPPTHDYMPYLSASSLITMPGNENAYGDTAKLRVYNSGIVTWNRVFPKIRAIHGALICRHTQIYSDSEPFEQIAMIQIGCSGMPRKGDTYHPVLRMRSTSGPPQCAVWLARQQDDYMDKYYNLVSERSAQWPLPPRIQAPLDCNDKLGAYGTFRLTDTRQQGRVVYRLHESIASGLPT